MAGAEGTRREDQTVAETRGQPDQTTDQAGQAGTTSAWSYYLVRIAILSVTAAFIVVMVLFAFLDVFNSQNASMSRKLWVRFFHCLEGIHREVTFQRPLLAAPQGYLRSQCARTHLVGKHPYYPRPPLYLPKEPLEHVRRAYAGMVASGVA